MYKEIIRPLLFLLPPNLAHKFGILSLLPLEYIDPLRILISKLLLPKNKIISTNVMGLEFPSPLGLAGGFDKNGNCVRALASLGFGFIEVGTITAIAQKQNKKPNIFRLPQDRAIINRLGFPNDGAEKVVSRLIKKEINNI